MLNALYEKHDERVNYLKTTALPADLRSGEPSDTDALTDSETLTRRQNQLKVEEAATQDLMQEMLSERAQLVEHFDKDTDLKTKILI